MRGILYSYFNRRVNQSVPLKDMAVAYVSKQKDGSFLTTFPNLDFHKLQETNGSYLMWSLDSLMKAGIDPNFAINTSYNSRLEGVNDIKSVDADVEKFLNENTTSKTE